VLDAAAARVAAGDLLSRRAWTARGLEMRLRRRGAAPEVAADVVADLAARGYVDDAAFARQWVAARAARGYGAARLRAELTARGVAPDVVGQALASLADDVQLERARAAAARRLASLGRAVPARAAARLRDHLLRRGFSGSTVSRVIREALGARTGEAGW
jgi:regulatory protein